MVRQDHGPGAAGRTLLIACGALAREIIDLNRLNAWDHLSVTCLPTNLAQYAGKNSLRRCGAKIRDARSNFDHIYVLYGDCGTGGLLDQVLAEEGVERIEGPHCYAFFSGLERFDELSEANLGCFYLTDYLARHFDRLIVQGLGIDRHPDLLEMYFGNYNTLVYMAQTDDPGLRVKAAAAAERLGLAYEYRFTGYGGLGDFMATIPSDSPPAH